MLFLSHRVPKQQFLLRIMLSVCSGKKVKFSHIYLRYIFMDFSCNITFGNQHHWKWCNIQSEERTWRKTRQSTRNLTPDGTWCATRIKIRDRAGCTTRITSRFKTWTGNFVREIANLTNFIKQWRRIQLKFSNQVQNQDPLGQSTASEKLQPWILSSNNVPGPQGVNGVPINPLIQV